MKMKQSASRISSAPARPFNSKLSVPLSHRGTDKRRGVFKIGEPRRIDMTGLLSAEEPLHDALCIESHLEHAPRIQAIYKTRMLAEIDFDGLHALRERLKGLL